MFAWRFISLWRLRRKQILFQRGCQRIYSATLERFSTCERHFWPQLEKDRRVPSRFELHSDLWCTTFAGLFWPRLLEHPSVKYGPRSPLWWQLEELMVILQFRKVWIQDSSNWVQIVQGKREWLRDGEKLLCALQDKLRAITKQLEGQSLCDHVLCLCSRYVYSAMKWEWHSG